MIDPANASLVERIALMSEGERAHFLAEAAPEIVEAIAAREWWTIARPDQQLPSDLAEAILLYLAGRGWGKTATGANGVLDTVRQWTPQVTDGVVRVALLSRRLKDVRLTMVEGETGLKRYIPPSMLKGGSWDRSWNRSTVELTLATGAILQGYSSEAPDDLRGPQHHVAWVDEPASFRDAREGIADDTTWSNLMFGMRLEPGPRVFVTGTPKPLKLIKDLVADPEVRVVRGSTYANLHNLSAMFKRLVVARYHGTRLGRQELDAEILEQAGNLFQRQWCAVVGDSMGTGVGVIRRRCWDLAGTEPNDSNPEPDWTCGVLLAKDRNAKRYRVEHVTRFRLLAGDRNARIVQQTIEDGLPVIGVEIEGGSGGKAQVAELAALLDSVKIGSQVGVKVEGLRPGSNQPGPKKDRAEPWLGAAQQGRLDIKDGDYLTPLLDEWEEFPEGLHDDQVDAMSGAWTLVNSEPPPPTTPAPGGGKQTSGWRT